MSTELRDQLAKQEGSPYHETGPAREMAFKHGWDAALESLPTEQAAEQDRWIAVSDRLPPFGVKVWFRAEIPWRKVPNIIKHFEDTLTTQTEQLEYGQTGYLLEENNDYVVTDSSFPKSELCSEYVTHWQPLPPAPTAPDKEKE